MWGGVLGGVFLWKVLTHYHSRFIYSTSMIEKENQSCIRNSFMNGICSSNAWIATCAFSISMARTLGCWIASSMANISASMLNIWLPLIGTKSRFTRCAENLSSGGTVVTSSWRAMWPTTAILGISQGFLLITLVSWLASCSLRGNNMWCLLYSISKLTISS